MDATKIRQLKLQTGWTDKALRYYTEESMMAHRRVLIGLGKESKEYGNPMTPEQCSAHLIGTIRWIDNNPELYI